MNLFEVLQRKMGCAFISDLPRLWREQQQSFAFAVLTLNFKKFEISQWIDLCNYLQIPFAEQDMSDLGQIRALFRRYA